MVPFVALPTTLRRFLWLVLIAILLCTPRLRAQNDFCNISNTSFKSGEVLRFKVYYNMGALWVPAGDASFSTTLKDYNGKKAYHVVGDGRTAKSYEWFYKVRDRYESYIDAGTMLPLKFIRNVNEGGMKIYNNVTFYHHLGRATSTNGSYSIPKCAQDVLSAIYFARNIDFSQYKPGDKIPFSMFLDDEVHKLYIRYIGKERITTRYGTFNTIRIAPLLIEGTLFKGGEKMSVWVSDDANHVPVRVDSPIIVGSVKVDLMSFENLRHPFKAFISKR